VLEHQYHAVFHVVDCEVILSNFPLSFRREETLSILLTELISSGTDHEALPFDTVTVVVAGFLELSTQAEQPWSILLEPRLSFLGCSSALEDFGMLSDGYGLTLTSEQHILAFAWRGLYVKCNVPHQFGV